MNKKSYSGQVTVKTQLTKLVFTIAFFALTFVSLTFVDPIGNINNDGLFSNILNAILSAFGYAKVNITQPAWETLFVTFGLLLVGIVVYLLLPLIFKSAYKKVVNNKLSKKILVDFLMLVVILVIVAIVFFGVIMAVCAVIASLGNIIANRMAARTARISIPRSRQKPPRSPRSTTTWSAWRS